MEYNYAVVSLGACAIDNECLLDAQRQELHATNIVHSTNNQLNSTQNNHHPYMNWNRGRYEDPCRDGENHLDQCQLGPR